MQAPMAVTLRSSSAHGYPDSFYRFAKIIPMLADPESFGGRADDAFDVVAIHLTDVPFGHIFKKPDDPSTAEKQFFDLNDKWLPKEGAYATIQSSKPQSLAYGLNDSPSLSRPL
jgi:hypothetical protein